MIRISYGPQSTSHPFPEGENGRFVNLTSNLASFALLYIPQEIILIPALNTIIMASEGMGFAVIATNKNCYNDATPYP
jgi:hypothetical protein